ncbi:rhodanese-like domain-containing protein [Polycladidibacter stylochi]|uniref:rhodanese-like domain-containing protein n=1 Tax=Polycladidibacter stylochi TaxID=1807766 RepID=UPI000830A8AD|nr:rhodanese-like domain-containing protein [Pseudovibrio stylochi]
MSTIGLSYSANDFCEIVNHYSRKLAFETDCSDVNKALNAGSNDFQLLDVRGNSDYAKGHIRSAKNIPHATISSETLQSIPQGTLLVVYCNGPHCNGADKAALKLASLGYQVKVMLGGISGWKHEGFALQTDC